MDISQNSEGSYKKIVAKLIVQGGHDTPMIIGKCQSCKRGENSMVIYKQQKTSNHREPDNNIVFLMCICCLSKYKTDIYTLTVNAHKTGEVEDET